MTAAMLADQRRQRGETHSLPPVAMGPQALAGPAGRSLPPANRAGKCSGGSGSSRIGVGCSPCLLAVIESTGEWRDRLG